MENFRDFRKDNRVRESYRNSLLSQIKSSLDEWVRVHEGARYNGRLCKGALRNEDTE